MSLDDVWIVLIGLVIIILVYTIFMTVLNSFFTKTLNEKSILNLEIQLIYQERKALQLIEKEKLLKSLDESLSNRVFELFKKIVSLQKFIFEIYH